MRTRTVMTMLGTGMLAMVAAASLTAAVTSIPVTTIISDYDSGIAPALQIQSDQLGAYKNGKNLQSYMYTVGSWEVDAYNVRGATRTVYLGFTKPVPDSGPNGGPPVAVPSGTYKAHVTTECFHYGTNPTTMAPGSTISCPMSVRFDSGGQTYTIHMNPQNANWTGTNPVTITCIFPTSGTNPCKQWKITPSASVVNPDGSVTYQSVGQLDLVGSSNGERDATRSRASSISRS